MGKSVKLSSEVRERAVRLGYEQHGQHESQWAAVVSIAGKIGATRQTLPDWVRQHERDTGRREDVTMAEARLASMSSNAKCANCAAPTRSSSWPARLWPKWRSTAG